jgi:hypothetical protein
MMDTDEYDEPEAAPLVVQSVNRRGQVFHICAPVHMRDVLAENEIERELMTALVDRISNCSNDKQIHDALTWTAPQPSVANIRLLARIYNVSLPTHSSLDDLIGAVKAQIVTYT